MPFRTQPRTTARFRSRRTWRVIVAALFGAAALWSFTDLRLVGMRAWAQVFGDGRAARRPSPLLSEEEVQIGLGVRLEAMRTREAREVTRSVQARTALSAEQRSRIAADEVLPRDPDPSFRSEELLQ